MILIALVMAAQASAPQAPIAAGSFASIVEVLGAAKACHVIELRISMYPADQLGEARLFLQEELDKPSEKCLKSWLAKNGTRLKLLPGWWKDVSTPARPEAD